MFICKLIVGPAYSNNFDELYPLNKFIAKTVRKIKKLRSRPWRIITDSILFISNPKTAPNIVGKIMKFAFNRRGTHTYMHVERR